MSAPIFVINMPHSIERKNKIKSQLSELNLTATYIEAVVGKELSRTAIDSLYDAKKNHFLYHRKLTLGEIGCYASHRKAWEQFLKGNHEWALVLEDDILINKNIIKSIQATDYINHADIIKLSDNRNNAPAQKTNLPNGMQCISYKKVPNCATGYLISRSGARKLLSRQSFFRPVDIDMQFHSELKLILIGLLPYCIKEADFESEIALQNTNGIHSNSSTFFRNLKYRLRMKLQRFKVSADLTSILK